MIQFWWIKIYDQTKVTFTDLPHATTTNLRRWYSCRLNLDGKCGGFLTHLFFFQGNDSKSQALYWQIMKSENCALVEGLSECSVLLLLSLLYLISLCYNENIRYKPPFHWNNTKSFYTSNRRCSSGCYTSCSNFILSCHNVSAIYEQNNLIHLEFAQKKCAQAPKRHAACT